MGVALPPNVPHGCWYVSKGDRVMNRLIFTSLALSLTTLANAQDDARDPHAYSAGYTQTDASYSLPNAEPSHMEITHYVSSILGERLEYDTDERRGDYAIRAWHGTSFNRAVLKTEGSFTQGDTYENSTQLLWGRAIAPFWDSLLGVRVDTRSEGKNRSWIAAGLQGLAPYWFDLDATAFVGTQGETEFVLNAEYDLLLTQRLILQPHAEITVRGDDDAVNRLGKGLSSASLGLRLRYEFSRQFAPYIGVESDKNYGNTASFLRAVNMRNRETRYFLGVRFWL